MKNKERHYKEPGSSGPDTAVKASHPAEEDLQRFMAGGLNREKARAVVRHLLSGCQVCKGKTRRLWGFGEEKLRPEAAPPALPAREVGVWR